MQAQTDSLQATPAVPRLVERERCPGCTSRNSRCLLKVPYADESMQSFLQHYYHAPPDTRPLDGWNYELVRCDDCKLAYQRCVPGPALLQDIYDRWISPKGVERDRESRTLDASCVMADEVHFLIRHFGLRPGEIRVLDFGMGWSKWLKMAQAYGCQVSGADLSIERQKYARSIGIEVLDWDEIPTRRFHYINAEQVFEHLVQPGEVLRHLAGALSENGVMRISVPNARSALRVVEKTRSFGTLSPIHIMPIQPLEHVNSFEPATLQQFGRLAGLEPLRPSLRLLYQSTSGWLSPKLGLKVLLRPVYRHVWPKSTIAFFRKRSVNP